MYPISKLLLILYAGGGCTLLRKYSVLKGKVTNFTGVRNYAGFAATSSQGCLSADTRSNNAQYNRDACLSKKNTTHFKFLLIHSGTCSTDNRTLISKLLLAMIPPVNLRIKSAATNIYTSKQIFLVMRTLSCH